MLIGSPSKSKTTAPLYAAAAATTGVGGVGGGGGGAAAAAAGTPTRDAMFFLFEKREINTRE